MYIYLSSSLPTFLGQSLEAVRLSCRETGRKIHVPNLGHEVVSTLSDLVKSFGVCSVIPMEGYFNGPSSGMDFEISGTKKVLAYGFFIFQLAVRSGANGFLELDH